MPASDIFTVSAAGSDAVVTAISTTRTVSDTAGLSAAIRADDLASLAGGTAAYTIDLANSITLDAQLEAINFGNGSSLTINGGGHTLDGGGTYNGLFVYAGTVTVDELTLANNLAIGGAGGNGGPGSAPQGRTAGGGGGGGAGLGGGLFVASGASVTLAGVGFVADRATGGAGGNYSVGSWGGGGGLEGGNGGRGGGDVTIGGGGGGGLSALGPTGSDNSGGPGIIPGVAGGEAGQGNYSTPGGPSGGAGGDATTAGGGGGGGGYFTGGNAGGFGGGAGGGGANALGGFGGGGGAGGGPAGNAGGFGAGIGDGDFGGGGLGAGGDIFVQQGGALVIQAGSLGLGTVSGGAAGGGSAGAGSGFGNGLFIQGNEAVTLAPGVGQTVDIAGTIADQTGSYLNLGQTPPSGSSGDGTPYAGAGSLLLDGAGTLTLELANTYVGGTTLAGGVLELAVGGTAGSGTIDFVANPATLQIDAPVVSGSTFANVIANFAHGDTIDLRGLTFVPGATCPAGAPADECAPRITDGEAFDRLRARHAARAVALGLAVPLSVVLEITGEAILGITVPADTAVLRLVSPCAQEPGGQRRLGALIRGLRVDGAAIDLRDPRLASGVHGVEIHNGQMLRWTNGEANLALGTGQRDRWIEIDVVATVSEMLRAA